MSNREFVTLSYLPEQRPELHARLQAMPTRGRSREICDLLDPSVTPIVDDERLDRVLELVERMATQNDCIEHALRDLVKKLAHGTPMQAIVEQIEDGDLPDDVIANVMDL